MNEYASRLWLLMWRLLPGNPILVRVVHGASRRSRHLWIRFGYLGVLLAVVLIAMVGPGAGSGAMPLSDLAKNASTMFMWASITQLALMCFLSPVFTAAAITQERDAQTFNILVSTPLSNAQIVLGSLMSRLFFVLALLLAGLPIFLAMMIYGGVTLAQIVQSFAIAGSTAVLTGALAICISMIRVGTQRTIFSFYLMIGLFLLAVFALGRWPGTWIAEAPLSVGNERLSWLAAFHPFLALEVALNRMPAPDVALLGGRGAVARYFLAYPHRAYVVVTLAAAALLTVLSMFFVRRPKEGEAGILASLVGRLMRREPGERRRKPRTVWRNPVAWREATTRASVTTRGFLNFALIGGGLLAGALLFIDHLQSGDVGVTREWLSVVLAIELGLILLVATNTAATAITKERESNSMELLLVSPLTSRYLVWGKLRGLVTFTLPLIAIPTVTVLAFGVHGLFVDTGLAVVPIEAAAEIALLLIVYAAGACMWGLHMSLHSKRTVQAVMVSVGGVVVVSLIATLVCEQIITTSFRVGATVAPFTPFTGVRTLVNPIRLFGSPAELANGYNTFRVHAAVGCAITVVLYAMVAAGVYKSMVRNFDMIVRRQSAQT